MTNESRPALNFKGGPRPLPKRETDHMSETIKVTIEQATVADFRRVETKTAERGARDFEKLAERLNGK